MKSSRPAASAVRGLADEVLKERGELICPLTHCILKSWLEDMNPGSTSGPIEPWAAGKFLCVIVGLHGSLLGLLCSFATAHHGDLEEEEKEKLLG